MRTRTLRLQSLLGIAVIVAACGGGGSGGSSSGGGGGGPPPTSVTISGRITFDRVPFKTSGQGLNLSAPSESPARQVVVQAVEGGSTVLTSTTTDTSGNYSMSVAGGHTIVVRARAQMQQTGTAPTWTFSIRNNTNGNALYALDSSSFTTSADSVHNLHATTGWNGSSYATERQAAPFAILDTVYKAKELILSAQTSTVFPSLDVFWSPQNINNATGGFCPSTGNIQSTAYLAGGGGDNCTPSAAISPGIYVQGYTGNSVPFSGDTDEFDEHVLAHEFGHYVEDKFARSDSRGGSHSATDKLDISLAWSEGWGDGFSGMAMNDPLYRDSQGATQEFGFNLETETTPSPGWFSETSVSSVLWDVFDSTNDAGDNVSLASPFAAIFAAETNGVKNTDALASIFSFSTYLKANNNASSAAIASLLNNNAINGTGDFATNETHDGGDPTTLPIFPTLTANSPTIVCTNKNAGVGNKLGNVKYFVLNLNTPGIAINVTAAIDPTNPGSVPAIDPDIYLFKRGVSQLTYPNNGNSTDHSYPGTGSTDQGVASGLTAGTYVLEVEDYAFLDPSQPVTTPLPHCMQISFQTN